MWDLILLYVFQTVIKKAKPANYANTNFKSYQVFFGAFWTKTVTKFLDAIEYMVFES